MQTTQFSFDRPLNRSAAFTPARDRRSADFDVFVNFGLLKRRASDSDTLSDRDSLYYQFRLDRRARVEMTIENRLERDPIAGFLQNRSFFGRFFNADGDTVSKNSGSARPEETVDLTTRRLRPGTYYLRLESNFRGDIRYRLQLRPLFG